MYVIDKLSAELGVNYLDLFNKANKYHSSEYSDCREDLRLPAVFDGTEIEFLACIALEFLRVNKIDDPNKMEIMDVDTLSDFADSTESERDELVTEVVALKGKIKDQVFLIEKLRLLISDITTMIKERKGV